MQKPENKLIPFANLFAIAADHIFDDPSLVKFIPDGNNAILSPENMRKKSQEAAIRLSLLHSEHAAINRALATETDSEMRKSSEFRRERLQEEIHATLQKWIPEAQLRDCEMRFEKESRAIIVLEKLLGAFANEKISLFLNSQFELPRDTLSRESDARFLPKKSILECKIDGETHSGIVSGDENEVRQWLVGEDVVAGVYDTPEKRMRKCAELYEARLLDPETRYCSKDEHFAAISAIIPGLLRKGFDAVRERLALKYPHVKKAGRRPKTHPEI